MITSITLGSEISDLTKMRPWLDALIHDYAVNEKTAFAMRLCLEEALSNIIRHGYNNQAGSFITINFQQPTSSSHIFIIEDTATHYSPQHHADDSADPLKLESLTLGGLGVNLLRKFTSDIAYEPLPTGNRLTLTFTS
jgi:anti-sigma regulatory factor (Ser/Thr protein kinase)